MSRPFWIFLAFVFAFTSLARAQTRSITVPVWVESDHCGGPPKFQATVNGSRVPVKSALGPSSDQIILVVLDLTSSLTLIDPAKQALISQISKLPPNTWVGLLHAQDGLHVLTDPGANSKPAIAAIRALSNSGQPGLLGTVTSALSLADGVARKSPVRVSVLYVTDGSIYSYPEDYTNPVINQSDPYDLSRAFPDALINDKISRLIRSASSLEAPLFVVQLAFRQDGLSEAYQSGLKTLARATGGASMIAQSEAGIPDLISQMFSRISDTWLLTLELPPKVHKDIRIHVDVPCREGSPRVFWRAHFQLREG